MPRKSRTVTRRQLVRAVAARTGVSHGAAQKILTLLLDSMRDELIAGATIEIRGFGLFRVVPYRARQRAAYDFKQRRSIMISHGGGGRVIFRPFRRLKLAVEAGSSTGGTTGDQPCDSPASSPPASRSPSASPAA